MLTYQNNYSAYLLTKQKITKKEIFFLKKLKAMKISGENITHLPLLETYGLKKHLVLIKNYLISMVKIETLFLDQMTLFIIYLKNPEH